jgi:transcriptional regulator with XRE-family HTH domain
MDLYTIKYGTLESVLLALAHRVRQRRLEINLTQKEFAKRVGIGYDAYRNFESTGDTSLKNIVLISYILDDVEAINQLFTQKIYNNIEEIIKERKTQTRQRATKNK